MEGSFLSTSMSSSASTYYSSDGSFLRGRDNSMDDIIKLDVQKTERLDMDFQHGYFTETGVEQNQEQEVEPEIDDDDDDDDDSTSSEISGNTGTDSCLMENKASKKPASVMFAQEKLHLHCEWENCGHETAFLNMFTEHVEAHVAAPNFEMFLMPDECSKISLICKWGNCPHQVTRPHDLLRHMYIHVFHSKLKSLGRNAVQRASQNLVCRGDPNLVNIVPELGSDLRCGWGACSDTFVNIQEFYDHIRYHCLDNLKGKAVAGGIKCQWKGCKGSYPNVTKLRDHMKSHTQEKLNACPTCGSLFATRTRLIDHCYRQKDEEIYSCELCLKGFASSRLLRDHIRSHVNNYRCSQCDMSCISPSALIRHMKYRHSAESPNQCQYCSYSAKTITDLRRHEKIHESALISCQTAGCNFVARNDQAVKVHQLRMHSDNKATRYHCHLCEQRYSRGSSLTKHLIRVHSLQWPSGHVRFRYQLQKDGTYSLLTVRYETEDVQTVVIARDSEELELDSLVREGDNVEVI